MRCNVVILGGGIAGLWLNLRLRALGYSTVLLERQAVGHGQSIHSQGILHGGIKYALNGRLNDASESIAQMPALWGACLEGTGEIDLCRVKVLSETQLMWVMPSLTSPLTNLLSSHLMVGRVEPLSFEQHPTFFSQSGFRGRLHHLHEKVLDIPHLLETMMALSGDSIWCGCDARIIKENDAYAVSVENDILDTDFVVALAGESNAALIGDIGIKPCVQQLRPLHMVLVKGEALAPIYVHCVAGGSTPIMTITSHQAPDGQWVWYLGGALAEGDAIIRDDKAQIALAKSDLKKIMPWIDTTSLSWQTLRINRAEQITPKGHRPKTCGLMRWDNLMVGWPTKLALSPILTAKILAELPKPNQLIPNPNSPLIRPQRFEAKRAMAPWETWS